MEWHPREIDECSLWEIAAYADGLNRANSPKTEPMSDEEFDELLAAHNIG